MDSWRDPIIDPFGGVDQLRKLDHTTACGVELKPGHRIRLRPIGRADIIDIALAGMTATIISIEQDFEDRVHLAVSIDDDPGSDLAITGKPGHRFFFGIDEVEPLPVNDEL